MGNDGPRRHLARHRPPVIVIASPALPARLLVLARHAVPLVLPLPAVTQSVLDRLHPAAVAIALFCPREDAARILARLDRMAYRGRVFLLSPPLPDRDMVARELRQQFPTLRLRVVAIGDMRPA